MKIFRKSVSRTPASEDEEQPKWKEPAKFPAEGADSSEAGEEPEPEEPTSPEEEIASEENTAAEDESTSVEKTGSEEKTEPEGESASEEKTASEEESDSEGNIEPEDEPAGEPAEEEPEKLALKLVKVALALLSGEASEEELLPLLDLAEAREAIERARAEGELVGRNAAIEERYAEPEDILPDLGGAAPGKARQAESIFDLARSARLGN